MRVYRVNATPDQLRETGSNAWRGIAEEKIALMPSLVELTGAVSPYLARTRGHGITKDLSVRMAHDGQLMSVRLEWSNGDPRDEINDLDQFADAAAVMFPQAELASAISMGAVGAAVNVWLWRADENQPYDVIAEGYSTSQRRPGSISSLIASQQHTNGRSSVVLQRPLTCSEASCVSFVPGTRSRVAFAVWSGKNNERSGQKSISGEFVPLMIDT